MSPQEPLAAGRQKWRFKVKGELLRVQDASKAGRTESCLQRAINITRRQSTKSLELRVIVSLARLLARRGHCDEAHAMLAEIYNWLTQGFETADLSDARALLDQLSHLTRQSEC